MQIILILEDMIPGDWHSRADLKWGTSKQETMDRCGIFECCVEYFHETSFEILHISKYQTRTHVTIISRQSLLPVHLLVIIPAHLPDWQLRRWIENLYVIPPMRSSRDLSLRNTMHRTSRLSIPRNTTQATRNDA